MRRSRKSTLLAAITTVITLGLPAAAWAQVSENCIRWSAEKEGWKCFECIQRVWTGTKWKLVNTCKPNATNGFTWGGGAGAPGPVNNMCWQWDGLVGWRWVCK